MATFIDAKVISAVSAPGGGSDAPSSPATPFPSGDDPVLRTVRAALGRAPDEMRMPPAPPTIDEPLVRLVYSDLGLAELFARVAQANHLHVHTMYVDELPTQLPALLQSLNVTKIGYARSHLMEKIGVSAMLQAGGFEAAAWPGLSIEAVYGLDCGLTDVAWAVAETGSLVIAPSADQGRLLSLAPAVHVAIVEPKNFVADLVDLLEKIPADAPAVHIISGPSKTADIEGHLVEGVHGPHQVHVIILQ